LIIIDSIILATILDSYEITLMLSGLPAYIIPFARLPILNPTHKGPSWD